jgi:4'-phosphopantetheinyl transferase
MVSVDLFLTDAGKWDIKRLQNSIPHEELSLLDSISHIPTLHMKIVSKALIRMVLHDLYHIDSNKMVFESNSFGKPSLKHYPLLYFNISHSGGKVLIGISQTCKIGVDIERVQPLSDEDQMAQSIFSKREYMSYRNYRLQSPKAFYRFWTAKEALLKGIGIGLGELESAPEIFVCHHRFMVSNRPNLEENWALHSLNIDKNYEACIATDHSDRNIQKHLHIL